MAHLASSKRVSIAKPTMTRLENSLFHCKYVAALQPCLRIGTQMRFPVQAWSADREGFCITATVCPISEHRQVSGQHRHTESTTSTAAPWVLKEPQVPAGEAKLIGNKCTHDSPDHSRVHPQQQTSTATASQTTIQKQFPKLRKVLKQAHQAEAVSQDMRLNSTPCDVHASCRKPPTLLKDASSMFGPEMNL